MRKLKCCCFSDCHGFLPENLPDCDCFILAGDFCPFGTPKDQYQWLSFQFKNWLRDLKSPIFVCAGNHDWPLFEMKQAVKELNLPWNYLEDTFVEFNDFKIAASPWNIRFYDWAFNLDEQDLVSIWDKIPSDTDILITHQPAYGYGDVGGDFYNHLGSPSLLKKIKDIHPLLHVTGHIHPARGIYPIVETNTVVVNASLVNEQYKPVHNLILLEIDNEKVQILEV